MTDASALLLERSGQVQEAITLLLTDLSTRLKVAEKDICGQMERQQGSSLVNILSKTGEDRSHAVMALPHYAPVRHIIECVTATCNRSSSTGSTELWFQALDHCIKEKKTLRTANSSSAELVSLVIVQLLQILLGSMMLKVPARDIIRRITEDKESSVGLTGSRFSDFKDILLNMISSYHEEFRTLDACINIQTDDCHEEHRKKFWRNCKAVRVHAHGGRHVLKGNGGAAIKVIEPPSWRINPEPEQKKTGLTSQSRLGRLKVRRDLSSVTRRMNAQGVGDDAWSMVSSLPCAPPPDLDDIRIDDERDDWKRVPGSLPVEAVAYAEIDFVSQGILG